MASGLPSLHPFCLNSLAPYLPFWDCKDAHFFDPLQIFFPFFSNLFSPQGFSLSHLAHLQAAKALLHPLFFCFIPAPAVPWPYLKAHCALFLPARHRKSIGKTSGGYRERPMNYRRPPVARPILSYANSGHVPDRVRLGYGKKRGFGILLPGLVVSAPGLLAP